MKFIDICCGALIVLGTIPLGFAIGSFFKGDILAGFLYGFISFFCFAAGVSTHEGTPCIKTTNNLEDSE